MHRPMVGTALAAELGLETHRQRLARGHGAVRARQRPRLRPRSARRKVDGGYTAPLTPPSMLIAVPVMNAARAEARKATSPPTSSGSANRPTGTFFPILS